MKSLNLSSLELEDVKRKDILNIDGGNIFLGFGPWNAGANLAWRVGSIPARIQSQNFNSNNGYYSNGYYHKITHN